MHIRAIIIGLLAWLAASPALADVIVHYRPVSDGGRRLTIEADNQGRIRAEDNRGQVILIRDGVAYLVQSNGGEGFVCRLEDFAALSAELLARVFGDGFRRALPTGYRLSERGPETIGQWRGTLYALEPIGGRVGSDPRSGDIELVVSDDPSLAQAGRATRVVFETLLRMIEALGGPRGAVTDQARTVLTHGAVLRMTREFVLEDFVEGPVEASRFEVPGPVLTRDELRNRMGDLPPFRGRAPGQ